MRRLSDNRGQVISDRKVKILSAIIRDFTESALPVGSRTISKKYLIGTSSATIRNEMADLEELGFLLSPHASAGRIPSDLGFRYFVDYVVKNQCCEEPFYEKVHNQLRGLVDPEEVSKKAAELISEFTGMAALVEASSLNKSLLERLILVKVSESKVLMILSTHADEIHTLEIEHKNANEWMLHRVSLALTYAFKGAYLEHLDLRLMAKICAAVGQDAEYFIPSLKKAFSNMKKMSVGTAGISSLLGYTDPEKFREILETVEDGVKFEQMVSAFRENEGSSIAIGSEIGNDAFSDLAIVSQSYRAGNSKRLVMAIGSKRMNYALVSSVVRQVVQSLEELYNAINL